MTITVSTTWTVTSRKASVSSRSHSRSQSYPTSSTSTTTTTTNTVSRRSSALSTTNTFNSACSSSCGMCGSCSTCSTVHGGLPAAAHHLQRFTRLLDKSFGDEDKWTDLSLPIEERLWGSAPSCTSNDSLAPIQSTDDILERQREKEYEVGWESDTDADNPMNWPWSTRWVQLILISGTMFARYVGVSSVNYLRCLPALANTMMGCIVRCRRQCSHRVFMSCCLSFTTRASFKAYSPSPSLP